jgi:GR25 family glycosyltransferase involved in LPS biosynthesis
MKVLVINLDKAHERWKSVKNEFIKENLNPERIQAIDSKNINLNLTSTKCKFICPTVAIAITMSHIKSWHFALKSGEESVLICEDDVLLKKDFSRSLELAKKELPPNWDILFVGCLFCQKNSSLASLLMNLSFKKNILANENYSEHLKIPEFVFGSHAYLVSKQGLLKLLHYFSKIDNAVDIQLHNLISDQKLHAFSLKNVLASQKVSVSASSITSSVPRFAKGLDKFFLAPEVSLRYGLSYPIANVGSQDLNGWIYVTFVYGFISGFFSFFKTFAILVIFLSPDLFEKDAAVIPITVSFLTGWIAGNALKRKIF